MKRKIRIVLLISLFLVLFLFLGYFLLAYYYRQGFSINTWINGVYCTGKSVEEVNSELLSKVDAPIIHITDEKGRDYEINLSKTGYQADFLVALQQFKQEQNPYLWIDNVTFHKNHEVLPLIHYDAESLRDAFCNLEPIKEELQKKAEFSIVWDENTKVYQLCDNLSARLDVEKAFQAFIAAVDAGGSTIDLAEINCYYDIPLTEEQEQTRLLWEKIDAFQNCDLIYDMGTEKIAFTPERISGFLEVSKTNGKLPILDENGSLVLNPDAVEAFVTELADAYDTYGKERHFMSTRGDEITLTKGTYGTTLDRKAEVTYLMENLLLPQMHEGVTKEHIPAYRRKAFARGLDDIGGTYLEIDMTEQKLYYYVEHSLKLETDIVTGNLRRKMGTPSGIYYVYNKQTNRILRGPGYASPVDYWMPVKGGIGIHDAGWRKEFGGEIYKKSGSHGCINLPSDVMPELYDMVEIGTPVIMFYD